MSAQIWLGTPLDMYSQAVKLVGAYFPLIRHGPHRELCDQRFFFYFVYINYRGNVYRAVA
jgi:hypothetical protein